MGMKRQKKHKKKLKCKIVENCFKERMKEFRKLKKLRDEKKKMEVKNDRKSKKL